ncbi:hypothetical protein NYE33_13315 [Paenibacillus sp. FSL R10-2199]|uniref:hypothetical protein n=1 Tax=Paenibacillus sp. FSL R10-2199 TaxID=2975348 RepID=UPI0030F7536F
MYNAEGIVDAVVFTAGQAYFGPIQELSPENNEIAILGKMKGQINLVLLGLGHVQDRGSFTLITGIFMDHPIIGGISLTMAGGQLKRLYSLRLSSCLEESGLIMLVQMKSLWMFMDRFVPVLNPSPPEELH